MTGTSGITGSVEQKAPHFHITESRLQGYFTLSDGTRSGFFQSREEGRNLLAVFVEAGKVDPNDAVGIRHDIDKSVLYECSALNRDFADIPEDREGTASPYALVHWM